MKALRIAGRVLLYAAVVILVSILLIAASCRRISSNQYFSFLIKQFCFIIGLNL